MPLLALLGQNVDRSGVSIHTQASGCSLCLMLIVEQTHPLAAIGLSNVSDNAKASQKCVEPSKNWKKVGFVS